MQIQPQAPTISPVISDDSLVTATLAGDGGAFAALVTRYQRAAIATCLAILRDRQLAEDAAQDAFVAAYRNLASLRDRAAFGGWLLSIARNRSARLAGQRAKHPPVTRGGDQHLAADPTPLPDEALLDALANLPDHERTVVMLRHFDGHDLAAVAVITGRPVGTVTKQLSRAHQRLRRTLEANP